MQFKLSNNTVYILFAAMVAIAFSSPVGAQGYSSYSSADGVSEFETLDVSDEIEWLKQEYVKKRSSELQKELREAAANVTIVSGQEIKDMGAATLLDVLRVVPNIGISTSLMGDTIIESRGIRTYNGNRILLSINGFPISILSFLSSSLNLFESMSVKHVHSVEIVKGPTSVLYGGAGYHLVINVVTKAQEELSSLLVYGGLGSSLYRSGGFVSGLDFFGNDVVAHYNFSDFRESSVENQNDFFAILAGDGLDLSKRGEFHNAWISMENDHYQLQANYASRRTGSEFSLGRFFNFQLPTTAINRRDAVYMLQAKAFLPLTEWATIVPAVSYLNSNNTVEVGTVSQNSAELSDVIIPTEVYFADLQLQLTPELPLKTIFGAKYEKTESPGGLVRESTVENNRTVYTQQRISGLFRDVLSFYNENIIDVTSWFRFFGGGRYEQVTERDSSFSSQFGAVFQPLDWYTLKVTYGRGHRSPEFADIINDLSAQANATAILTGLKNEQVENLEIHNVLELGLKSSAYFTYFLNNYEDLIDVNSETNQYENLLTSSIQGLELGLNQKLSRGSYFGVNVAYLEGLPFQGTFRNSSTSQTTTTSFANNGVIPSVPQWRVKGKLNIQFNRYVNWFNELLFQSETERYSGDVRANVPSYYVFNTSFTIQNVFDDWSVRATILNVLDDVPVYPASGIDIKGNGREYSVEISRKF